MITVPDNRSLVDGITLNIIAHPDNPAVETEKRKHLRDGWLELLTEPDGWNRFYPTTGEWRTCVVWRASEFPVFLKSAEQTEFIELELDDVVDGITISEERLSDGEYDIFGLWMNLFYTRGERALRFSKLYHPLTNLAHTGVIGN